MLSTPAPLYAGTDQMNESRMDSGPRWFFCTWMCGSLKMMAIVCVCVCETASVRVFVRGWVCECIFPPLNARLHLNIIGLFACHFPSSHSVYNKLHRLALWVTEAFIRTGMIPDENIFCWKSRFHADYTPNIQRTDVNRHISVHWVMNTLIVVKLISFYIGKATRISLPWDIWFQCTALPASIMNAVMSDGHTFKAQVTLKELHVT